MISQKTLHLSTPTKTTKNKMDPSYIDKLVDPQNHNEAEFDWRTTDTHNKFVKSLQLVMLIHDEAKKKNDFERKKDKMEKDLINAKLEEVKKDAKWEKDFMNAKLEQVKKEKDFMNAKLEEVKKDAKWELEDFKKDAKFENDVMKLKMELLEATVKALASGQAKAPKRAAAQQPKGPKEHADKQSRLY